MERFTQGRTLSLVGLSVLVSSACSALGPRAPSNTTSNHLDAPLSVSAPLVSQDTGAPTSGRDYSTVSLGVGRRQLDEDYWLPVDEPMVFDFEYAHEPAGQALGFEVGFALALAFEDEFVPPVGDIDFTNTQFELWGGLRKTFMQDALARPYLGVGLTLLAVQFEGESGGVTVDDEDWTVGGYAHGGFQFALGATYLLALDLRIVRGTDVELFDVSGDADYEQLALRFGMRL